MVYIYETFLLLPEQLACCQGIKSHISGKLSSLFYGLPSCFLAVKQYCWLAVLPSNPCGQ